MASRGSVINAALRHLRQPESDAPTTDTSTWVRRVRNVYDERVKGLLEGHPWNFAKTVTQLTATEPTPEGWDYGFAKPAGCVRILKVTSTNDPDAQNIAYDDRAGRICTNSETTFLTCIDAYWINYEGAWPQVFADAVSADIAAFIAPVTEAGEIDLDRLEKKSGKLLRSAKTWDAQQMPNRTAFYSQWDAARLTGSGSREDG